eukprot:GILJ01012782.1.p1 GENE.GILJ01012782.1~~GILJ01012782.1.p1  ORF type:complete len:312 (-),score=20.83 GILJ01012782.1:151-1086(-)
MLELFHLVCVIWVVLIGSAFISLAWKPAKQWSKYGKIRSQENSSPASIWAHIDGLLVPKQFFAHYYLLGAVFNAFLLQQVSMSLYHHKKTALLSFISDHNVLALGQADCFRCVLCCCLMQVHLLRRCYESFFITVFSATAKMHLLVYILGIGFYMLTSFSILLESEFMGTADSDWFFTDNFTCNVGSILSLSLVSALFLFIFSSYSQHRSHRILADLRTDHVDSTFSSTKNSYRIPRGGLFDLISCPHYFAEFGIYVSFIILTQGRSTVLWLQFIWVVVNLTITANRTHRWYREKFKNYPRKRKTIIPYVF